MNAQRSFDPPQHAPQRRKSPISPQPGSLGTTKTVRSFSRKTRTRLNPAYAHRRQGLEAIAKLVTYSSLSLFGIVTLVHSISYNWSQQSKLQHLETELQEAKIRTDEVNNSFSRSFDPQTQKNVMQDNSHKVAQDQRKIFLVSPSDLPSPKNTQSK
jgi:hypothetical protein